MESLKKNQIYRVNIDAYSSDGGGVCRVGGRAVFVPCAIPGEEWEIKLVKVTATAVYARGERLIAPSAQRTVWSLTARTIPAAAAVTAVTSIMKKSFASSLAV